jgi:hypothetical protein
MDGIFLHSWLSEPPIESKVYTVSTKSKPDTAHETSTVPQTVLALVSNENQYIS